MHLGAFRRTVSATARMAVSFALLAVLLAGCSGSAAREQLAKDKNEYFKTVLSREVAIDRLSDFLRDCDYVRDGIYYYAHCECGEAGIVRVTYQYEPLKDHRERLQEGNSSLFAEEREVLLGDNEKLEFFSYNKPFLDKKKDGIIVGLEEGGDWQIHLAKNRERKSREIFFLLDYLFENRVSP